MAPMQRSDPVSGAKDEEFQDKMSIATCYVVCAAVDPNIQFHHPLRATNLHQPCLCPMLGLHSPKSSPLPAQKSPWPSPLQQS
ncbi:hypothetical protein MUK42_30866 [Musa troglodytarum]|uniref:Uncharacterized protein n=1 Tax=Musa troglodytarum TaxID=320322 RepID=A0A9E7K8D7_9LILI|nr:hypothetical protein MUK42_30866 [Musa troglodytarum]